MILRTHLARRCPNHSRFSRSRHATHCASEEFACRGDNVVTLHNRGGEGFWRQGLLDVAIGPFLAVAYGTRVTSMPCVSIMAGLLPSGTRGL